MKKLLVKHMQTDNNDFFYKLYSLNIQSVIVY